MKKTIINIAILMTVFLIIRVFGQAVLIPAGGTMEPGLVEGDRIWVNTWSYKNSKPSRGDIIVFTNPDPEQMNAPYVQRIVAFAGEEVLINEGDVYINGSPVTELTINSRHYSNAGKYGEEDEPFNVPEGHFFVLADDSGTSVDSRFFGPVANDALIGKGTFIFLPFGRMAGIR